ncbi:hypothetical protein EON76_04735 [bacterium]|nr:MAG: hypothetical protein EON76_04735 [bacterium]
MSSERHLSSSDIWVPGQLLDHEYPTATPDELAVRLGTMVCAKTVGMDAILGAVRVPEPHEQIEGIASIDLCEVVRGTVKSMAVAFGREYVGNDYLIGIWGDSHETVDNDVKQSTICSLAHVLMNNGHVPAVENIDAITTLLRRWRNEENVFCIANTSTLPGNELATLEFMDGFMPDCFDGIAFPRNHNGRGLTTKAAAVSEVNAILNTHDQQPHYAVHIDDVEHHVATMATHPPLPVTKVFVPLRHYRPDEMAIDENIGNDDARRIARSLIESADGLTPATVHSSYMTIGRPVADLPNVVCADYPLDAFVKMDQFIREMQ